MGKPVFPLQDQLRGYSRALFSTWLYHRRFNILFDAGENVTTNLLNRVFGIQRIFLSHGHADHIAGLVNLLNIRNLGAGDQTAALHIGFPRNNALIVLLRNYLAQTQTELSFDLIWEPLEPDMSIPLDEKKGKLQIRTFRTNHSHKQLSLGYNIIETRSRLLPEFQNRSQQEINEAIWRLGKDNVAERFDQIIFTYGGDSRPIPPEKVAGSLFLCHECTYLKDDDDERNFHQHSVLDEVLTVAKEANVQNVLLFHFSLRYLLDEVRTAVREAVRRIRPSARIILLFGDRILELDEEESVAARRRNARGREEQAKEDQP